jgi:ADP-ribose pyrophosphatase
MAKQDFEILQEELSFDGFFRILTLELRHTLFAGGWSAPLRRELFVRDECVGVLLYDPERDNIVLLEQFRVGLVPSGRHPWVLELVAGIIEPGETPEQVVRREALEESGCEIAELVRVAEYYSSPGGSSEYFHLYCGRISSEGVEGIYGLPDEGEDIRAHVFSYEAAMALLTDGTVSNAHTMLALQWLQLNKSSLRKQWL